MDFSEALKAVKTGKAIQRSGWNGKGMFLYLANNGIFYYGKFDVDCTLEKLPFIVMKTADNKLVPWLASQTDILAEDWQII